MAKDVLLDALHIFDYWDMLDGGSIVVACSGGPDSTAMACAVAQFIRDPKNEFYWNAAPPKLILWHLDHMLRETSARDAEFVHDLGEKLGARVVVEREDIRALARRRKMNLEAMGRERRYALLDHFCVSSERLSVTGASTYAFTAHHMNDQAETVLMRMLRGAHAKGLMGIAPHLGEYVYRPWLGVKREQIMNYLASLNQDFVQDESNEDISRRRNLIRHQVLPLLESISAKAVERIAHIAVVAARAEAFTDLAIDGMHITRLDQDVLAQCLPLACRPRGKYAVHISPDHWLNCPVLVEYASRELTQAGLSLEARHMDALRALYLGWPKPVYVGSWTVRLIEDMHLAFSGPSAAITPPEPLQLSKGHWVANALVELRIEKASSSAWRSSRQETELPRIGDLRSWPFLLASLFTGPPKSAEWNCFLSDTVHMPLAVRTWRHGDRIKIAGGGTKKLSDVFIDAKVPPAFRQVWLVLVDANDEVLWVPGLADSTWMAHGAKEDFAHQVRIVAKPPYDAEFAAQRTQWLIDSVDKEDFWDEEAGDDEL
jgi:tRNA(Ile)-lysidine synthase